MEYTKRDKSVVDIIFIIAVLGVFMISVLFVILFGARIFKNTVNDMNTNFNSRTSLSYITEKLHQHDYKDGIELTRLNEMPILKLNQRESNIDYSTYLYEHDGYLKELTLLNDVDFVPSAGKTILKINGFNVYKISESLYRFNIVDEDGVESEFYIALYSNSIEGGSNEK